MLDTGKDYPDPSGASEAHGTRFVSLIKISIDEGITGWSDIETQPHAGKSTGQPVSTRLGATYRSTVRGYASTLVRPTPEAMKAAVSEHPERASGRSRPAGAPSAMIPW